MTRLALIPWDSKGPYAAKATVVRLSKRQLTEAKLALKDPSRYFKGPLALAVSRYLLGVGVARGRIK
jgi:hypothetical protein